MLHDQKFLSASSNNPNMLVPWYLMASYAYYHLDAPILTDAVYDRLCRSLYEGWDGISHKHKARINRSDVLPGTCLLPPVNFPPIAVGAVMQLLRLNDKVPEAFGSVKAKINPAQPNLFG